MKLTTSNRNTNIMTIIAFIAIYASILVVCYRPMIGFPFFIGALFLGFLSTFNKKKPQSRTPSDTRCRSKTRS